jgi:hypothetical protein
MIETIRNRVKIINRIWFRVIFLQINRSCQTRNHSRCLFKTCRSRICFSHFWTMKSFARFSLNVFIVTKKIIYTKENASSSMRILELKKFICRKKEFISTFIILKFFTFEWFFTKVSDNALKTQKNQFIQIASSQFRSKFIEFAWKKNEDWVLYWRKKKKSRSRKSRILRKRRRHFNCSAIWI